MHILLEYKNSTTGDIIKLNFGYVACENPNYDRKHRAFYLEYATAENAKSNSFTVIELHRIKSNKSAIRYFRRAIKILEKRKQKNDIEIVSRLNNEK